MPTEQRRAAAWQRALARLRRRRGDGGFTVIEVAVALLLISVVVISFTYLVSRSLLTVAYSNQYQAADALVNQTLEEVRALKYAAVQAGLDATNDTASLGSDPTLTLSGGTYTFGPTHEALVAGTGGSVPAPLYPHLSTQTVHGTTYQLGTYVTRYSGSTTAFRVTVIASWAAAAIRTGSTSCPWTTSNVCVSAQTVVTSPASGCLSAGTHPFAAPCQPFLYGQAATGSGFVDVSSGAPGNAISNQDGANGVALSFADVDLAHADATAQIEQTAHVASGATTTGASLKLTGSAAQAAGAVVETANADNDPATTANRYAYQTLAQAGTSSLSASGPGSNANGISVTPTDGDTGSSVATASAATAPTPACTDLSGVVQTSGQPCGWSKVQQAGTATTAATTNLLLSIGGSPTTTPLVTVTSPTTPSQAFVERLTAPSGAYCPTTTSVPGCVHAGASRTLGTVSIGALPSGLGPAGWNGYLVRLTGYSDTASAEAGTGTASPAASASGTLSWWNGTGYTSATLGGAAPAVAIPDTTASGTVNGQPVTVAVTGSTLAAGAAPTTSSPTCSPSGDCQRTAQVSSPLKGTLGYQVTVAGQVVATLVVTVDLGALVAQTNYKPAPSAS